MALTRDDVAGLDAKAVEKEMRAKMRDLHAFRAQHGGSLNKATGADRAKVKELGDDLNVLGERLDEARGHDDDARFMKLSEYLEQPDPARPHPGHPGATGSGGEQIKPVGSMWGAMRSAGFELGRNSRVTVPPGVLWGTTTYFAPDALAPRRSDIPILAGADRRYVFPALRSDPMSPLDTAVDFVRQTSRTLATPALMRRAIDAVTEKPESANAVELAHEELEQIAHKISGVPNIVFRQPSIRQVIDNDLRLGLAEALDAQAVAIIGAAGLTAGGTGSSLAARIRKAMTVVQAAGFEPNTVALSPADAEALDLELLDILNSTNTLPNWGLQVRVGKSVTTGFVFDRFAFGTVHASPAEVASFEENDGATNSQLLRAELNAITVVDQVDAAAALGAAA